MLAVRMPDRPPPARPGPLQRSAAIVSLRLGRESALVRWLRPWYERLLDLATGGRGYLQTVNQTDAFYVSPKARHLFPNTYEPEVFAFLRRSVPAGATCLNVGAHVGIYSLALARWVGPTGRVVAFEPNPGTADLLEQHVRRNEVTDRVTVVREAVGSLSGKQQFYATGLEGFSRLGMPNSESPAGPAPAEIVVQLTTIDAYCDRQGIEPDWIVMDIEGYELAALEGAVRTIARRAGQMQVVAEFHPALWLLAGYDARKGHELLARLGLSPTSLSGQRDLWTEHGVVLLRAAVG